MSNIFLIAAIINPIFATLLTFLFFIETKKLKKYFGNIDFVINDTSRNSIRAVRDDFHKLNQNIDSLTNNTNINTSTLLKNSELISKNSILTKETYQSVISSIDNQSKVLNELVKKIDQTNESINKLKDSLETISNL
tara:strand:+ start:3132 stop:3542 length:411 start_codon:yes stop_codon:yes gene_type:complete